MQRQDLSLDEDLPTITSNMVNKGEKPIIEECSSNMEIEETRHHTHLKIGATVPCDYKRLAGGSDEEYEEQSDHSAITTSRLHASSQSGQKMTHMAE